MLFPGDPYRYAAIRNDKGPTSCRRGRHNCGHRLKDPPQAGITGQEHRSVIEPRQHAQPAAGPRRQRIGPGTRNRRRRGRDPAEQFVQRHADPALHEGQPGEAGRIGGRAVPHADRSAATDQFGHPAEKRLVQSERKAPPDRSRKMRRDAVGLLRRKRPVDHDRRMPVGPRSREQRPDRPLRQPDTQRRPAAGLRAKSRRTGIAAVRGGAASRTPRRVPFRATLLGTRSACDGSGRIRMRGRPGFGGRKAVMPGRTGQQNTRIELRAGQAVGIVAPVDRADAPPGIDPDERMREQPLGSPEDNRLASTAPCTMKPSTGNGASLQ